jgi:hypothetical protein
MNRKKQKERKENNKINIQRVIMQGVEKGMAKHEP